MASLPETSNFDAGVYQLETTDPVQGGAAGVSNSSAKNLTNRTRWLYDQVASIFASGFAGLASPAFTGSPTAPTQATGDYSTKIATDAFVQNSLNGVASVNVAGNSNVTLTQAQWGCGVIIFFGALTGNINVIFPTQGGRWLIKNITSGAFTIQCRTAGGTGVLVAQSFTKAIMGDAANILWADSDLTSPALTGVPTAPTAAGDTNTTQIATTAFVLGQRTNSNPIIDGTATPGVSLSWARADHVHPTDTTRAPVASPTFTGTPAAPTAGGGTNTTQLATTAYVQGELVNYVQTAAFATNGQFNAGTATNKAVTPANLAQIGMQAEFWSATYTVGLVTNSSSFQQYGNSIAVTKRKATNQIFWWGFVSWANDTSSSGAGAVVQIRITYNTGGSPTQFDGASNSGTEVGGSSHQVQASPSIMAHDNGTAPQSYTARLEVSCPNSEQVTFSSMALYGVETWS